MQINGDYKIELSLTDNVTSWQFTDVIIPMFAWGIRDLERFRVEAMTKQLVELQLHLCSKKTFCVCLQRGHSSQRLLPANEWLSTEGILRQTPSWETQESSEGHFCLRMPNGLAKLSLVCLSFFPSFYSSLRVRFALWSDGSSILPHSSIFSCRCFPNIILCWHLLLMHGTWTNTSSDVPKITHRWNGKVGLISRFVTCTEAWVQGNKPDRAITNNKNSI